MTGIALLCGPGAVRAQSAFADSATEALVRAAQARHRTMGEDLPGYRADILTRSVGTVGATRWAPDYTVITHEMLARVQWQRPNDLRVDVVGIRSRSVRLPGVSARDVAGFWTETFAGEPWFAARFLGDDIELVGVPDRPGRHPLAPDGDRWYRYAITDSATLVLGSRTVHAIAVAVEPAGRAPFPLLTGQIWLDRESLDLVRLIGALAGPGLWEDPDPESPRLVGLEMDLEYGLHDATWWLPSRQIVTTHWTYRYLPGAALTGISTTTFTGHEVAGDSAIVFRTSRDRRRGRWSVWTCDFTEAGQRCGSEGLVRSRHRDDGSWEVVIPPLDTILAYPFDSAFAFHDDLMDEAVLTDRLIAMSGWSARAPGATATLETVDLTPLEAFQFDRVRGLSLGAGAAARIAGPWALTVTARGALHEPFWTGAAGLVREDASGRFEFAARRHLAAAEPWTPDGGLGPSMRALFLGADDADWYLAEGGVLRWRGYRGATRGMRMAFAVERHASVVTASGSLPHDVLFGDGDLQANPPVAAGWVTRVAAERRMEHVTLGADVLAGAHGLGGRAWARASYGPLAALVGTTGGDVLPQQEFRLGGPATVRGGVYGTERVRHVWALQADWPIAAGPYVDVIPFADVAGAWSDADPHWGLGLGVADSEGLIRLDLAVALRPERHTRFDVRLALPR